MGDNMEALFNSYLTSNQWILALSVAVLPTTWVRGNYKIMVPLSYTGLIVLMISLTIVAYKLLAISLHEDLSHIARDDIIPRNIFACSAMMLAAFSGHVMMPSLRSNMQEPKRFVTVINTAYCNLLVAFAIMGTAGYLTFGAASQSLVTLNFAPGNFISVIVQASFVVAMYSKIGLTLNPVAEGVEKRLAKWFANSISTVVVAGKPTVTWMPSIAIRSLLLAMATATAVVTPNFPFVQGLIGALLSTVTAIVLPVLCYTTVHHGKVACAIGFLCVLLQIGAPIVALASVFQLLTANQEMIRVPRYGIWWRGVTCNSMRSCGIAEMV